MDIEQEIKEQINANPILLYMKGSPDAPQCGFSSRATQLLISCGKPFSFVDILLNPEIRAKLPKVSNWPTFPQLFVNGELIGGCDLAKELVETAIKNGKHVVTANKALIASHGDELFKLAKEKNVHIGFEASVAGGTPVIKALREGLVANKVQWFAGILNGTTNFILSEKDINKEDTVF